MSREVVVLYQTKHGQTLHMAQAREDHPRDHHLRPRCAPSTYLDPDRCLVLCSVRSQDRALCAGARVCGRCCPSGKLPEVSEASYLEAQLEGMSTAESLLVIAAEVYGGRPALDAAVRLVHDMRRREAEDHQLSQAMRHYRVERFQ